MINSAFVVIDTETTGLDFLKDKVIEIAGVLVRDRKIIRTAQTLIDPGIPIPPEASAVHHLTDKDVAGKIKWDDAIALFKTNLEIDKCDAIAAHNAAFDKGMAGDLGKPWLCTYRLAKRLYPDFGHYSNQYLRYKLGLDVPAGPAHRALDDALVTANLLIHMLGELPASAPNDLNQFILRINSPLLLKTVGFGKHKDSMWADVPRDYMSWCLKQDMDPDILFTCRNYLNV